MERDFRDIWTLGFLLVMGGLFFFAPLIVILIKLGFRLGCRKVDGRVIRIERNRDPETGSFLIQPVIEFFDENGGRAEVKTGTGYGSKYMPRLNQMVKLYVRPGSYPIRFQVASRGLWEVSGILMLTGLALLLPVLLVLLRH